MSTMNLARIIALACVSFTAACGAAAPQAATDPSSLPPEPTAADKRAAAAELYRRGKEQLRSGDSLRAQEYFATAIDSGGDANVIVPELMRAATAGMRFQAAIRYYEDFGSLMTRERRAELGLVAAVLYLGVEQPERAKSTLESVLRVHPNNARAHFLLGQVLQSEFADYAGSDAHYRAYLALEPNGESALAARAGLLKAPEDSLAAVPPTSIDARPVKGVAP